MRFHRLISGTVAVFWLGTCAALADPVGELTIVVANFGRELLDIGLATTQDLQYTSHIYDPLIGGDAKGELTAERGLAESWNVSPDAKTVTLELRQGVSWHDGRPFTADDIVFTLGERLIAPDANCTLCRTLRNALATITATDARVRIVLKQPDPTFIRILSSRDSDIRVLARHNYKKTDQGYELVGNPIGTGPWKFVSFERGVDMRFAANTRYWDAARIPDFATMRLLPRAQASTRLSMVRSREADMAFIDPRQTTDAKRAGLRLLKLENSTIGTINFMGCWQADMLCHDTRFRKAVAHAIDINAIVRRVYPEDTARRIANSIWTPAALGYDAALAPYNYDPELAKSLLKEVGYDGRPVKLWSVVTNSSPESPEVMQLVDGYLRAAGFKTELSNVETGAFRPRYISTPQNFETRYAAHLYIDSPGARPMVLPNLGVSFISQKAGGVFQAYWNPERMDAEYAKLKAITDVRELDVELRRINRETYAEYSFVTIAARDVVAAGGPRVKSWSPGNYGYAWNLGDREARALTVETRRSAFMASSLIRGKYVICRVDNEGRPVIIEDGGVFQRDGLIVEVGKADDLAARHAPDAVIGSLGDVVFPGLVNAHHHIGLTPLQLGTPHLPLELWVVHRVGARGVDLYLDTLYSAFEMVECGVTTVQHLHGRVPAPVERVVRAADEVMRAYDDVGMRVSYSFGVHDEKRLIHGEADADLVRRLPPDLAPEVAAFLKAQTLTPENGIEIFETLHRRYAARERVRIQFAPGNLHWCSDRTLELVAEAARRHGVTRHMHLAETAYQKEYARRRTGTTVVRHLHKLGVLGPDLTLGHCTWLTDDEIDLMAETRTCICHNCSSNLRLRSGVAPLNVFRRRGINVALGIDEAGINDNRDMLQEMRLVLRLHRIPGMDDNVPTCADVFRMASEEGAMTTPFGARIGAIEPGRAADMVVLPWRSVAYPFLDPDVPVLDAVVQRAAMGSVDTVIVAGEVILRGGRFTKIDKDVVLSELAERMRRPPSETEARMREIAHRLVPFARAFYEGYLPDEALRDPFYKPSSKI